MKAGVLFFIIANIKDYLVMNQMLQNDGTLILTDISKDIEIAAIVEQTLKQHGVDTPDQLDKVMNALPLLVSFIQ